VEGPLDRLTGGLKSGQCVRHFVHRHEPPVPAVPITVLHSVGGLVAVNKPAGMPVHVAGQYRKNTVVGILEASRPDLGTLHPVHRLDKPVSGVLLLAQHGAAADAVRERITAHEVSKVYIARVEGEGCMLSDHLWV
jgi:tRNA pseudouridine32 synthase